MCQCRRPPTSQEVVGFPFWSSVVHKGTSFTSHGRLSRTPWWRPDTEQIYTSTHWCTIQTQYVQYRLCIIPQLCRAVQNCTPDVVAASNECRFQFSATVHFLQLMDKMTFWLNLCLYFDANVKMWIVLYKIRNIILLTVRVVDCSLFLITTCITVCSDTVGAPGWCLNTERAWSDKQPFCVWFSLGTPALEECFCWGYYTWYKIQRRAVGEERSREEKCSKRADWRRDCKNSQVLSTDICFNFQRSNVSAKWTSYYLFQTILRWFDAPVQHRMLLFGHDNNVNNETAFKLARGSTRLQLQPSGSILGPQ